VNAFVKVFLFSVAASGVPMAAVLAADLPLPPKQERALPAQQPDEFAKLGADCVEAFDGCRRFTHAGDGKFDAANNIGIACQPKPLICSKRK
jgi:hypothetical protein